MNINKITLISFSTLMLLSGCTKQPDNNVQNKINVEENNYKVVNSDDIYDYLDEDCKKIFEAGTETFNSYSSLKNIGEEIFLQDTEGNELNLSGKTLLHIIGNVGCDYLDGSTEKFYKQIIEDYGYHIYQVFLSESDEEKYFKKINTYKQELEGLKTVIIDQEKLLKLGLDNTEELVFIKDNKIVLDRKAGMGTIDTFDFADKFFIDKIASCSTLKESLNKYEADNIKPASEIPQNNSKELSYNNEKFNDVFKVNKDEEYVIGIRIDKENLKVNDKASFSDGIRDMVGTLSDKKIYINKKPEGEVLYEEENANVFIKVKVNEHNKTGYLTEADGGISYLYLTDGKTNYDIKLEPIISYKIID